MELNCVISPNDVYFNIHRSHMEYIYICALSYFYSYEAIIYYDNTEK